ncbi:MAG TPA: hypothetical protein VKV26_23250 [Dehalococcoidia bacterium]|nr:hypothetical protein [Dehalococcoidia bacterium]
MATTNTARSPKRIRRWLQTSAVGSVLVSSSLFGLIAAQSSGAAAQAESAPVVPAFTWHSPAQGAEVATRSTAPAVVTPPAVMTRKAVPSVAATPTVHARTRAS